MKVLNIIDGTAGAVLKLAEVVPLEGLYLPDVIRAVVEKYAFVQTPSFVQETISEKGLPFGMGKFLTGDKEANIMSLTLYNDAILANCYSTELAQSLLRDLLSWAGETFGLRICILPEDRVRLASRLMAAFEPSALRNFDAFNETFQLAAQMYRQTYGMEREIAMSRFQFDIDRSTLSPSYSYLPAFIIERDIEQPFSSNRFWCQAPLHTRDHIRLLETLEGLAR